MFREINEVLVNMGLNLDKLKSIVRIELLTYKAGVKNRITGWASFTSKNWCVRCGGISAHFSLQNYCNSATLEGF